MHTHTHRHSETRAHTYSHSVPLYFYFSPRHPAHSPQVPDAENAGPTRASSPWYGAYAKYAFYPASLIWSQYILTIQFVLGEQMSLEEIVHAAFLFNFGSALAFFVMTTPLPVGGVVVTGMAVAGTVVIGGVSVAVAAGLVVGWGWVIAAAVVVVVGGVVVAWSVWPFSRAAAVMQPEAGLLQAALETKFQAGARADNSTDRPSTLQAQPVRRQRPLYSQQPYSNNGSSSSWSDDDGDPNDLLGWSGEEDGCDGDGDIDGEDEDGDWDVSDEDMSMTTRTMSSPGRRTTISSGAKIHPPRHYPTTPKTTRRAGVGAGAGGGSGGSVFRSKNSCGVLKVR